MEDEITKRELSDDELDNVSGGGCEENARNCCPQCGSTEAKTIFSREDGSLVECAVCGTGWKIPQSVLMITDCGIFYKKDTLILLFTIGIIILNMFNIGNTQNLT